MVVLVVVQVNLNHSGLSQSLQQRWAAASHGCMTANLSSSPPKTHSTAGSTHLCRCGTPNWAVCLALHAALTHCINTCCLWALPLCPSMPSSPVPLHHCAPYSLYNVLVTYY
jgi:hypothetical protein